MIKVSISIIAFFTLVCALVIALIFSFSATIAPPPPFSPQDISKLKKTLAKSNPLKFQRFKHQALVFDEQLLNQSANFALNKIPNTSVAIRLKRNIAETQGSIKLTDSPFDIYINFSCDILPSDNLLKISNIYLGTFPIPHWIANRLTPIAVRYIAKNYPDYIDVIETVKKIDIDKNKLTVHYHWNAGLSKKIKIAGRNFLLAPEQQKLIGVYYQTLGNLSRIHFWHSIGLHQVIRPIFELAQKRTANGSDPIKENEAALLALGIMASGVRVNHLLQDKNAKPFPNAYFFRLSLLKRRDLMQHFLISAALTVSTNKLLSDTIGLAKEMDDSEGGSGFSFADLLADRAGVKLAQLATENESSAQNVQVFLSQTTLEETDFMPPHDNLPESITALQFKEQYIDIHHEKYLFVEQELQQRISSRSIYQD